MKPNWMVTAVVPKEDYTLYLTFASGETKVYNAKPLLSKLVCEPLKNIKLFTTARVSGDTVVWNDDIDIAPEHLYECSIAEEQTKQATAE